MNNEINLLPHSSRTISRSLSRRNKLLRFVALLLLFTVPTGSVILFLLILFSPLPSLQQQEKLLLANTAIQQEKIASVLFINDRAQKSSAFIAARNTYPQIVQEILTNLPSNVRITQLTLQADTVSLSAASTSLDALQMYQQGLSTSQTAQFLYHLQFQTVSLTAPDTTTQQVQEYQMTLSAQTHA